MTVSYKPIYPQNPNAGGLVQILPADTTTKKTIITAGANGTLVYNISVHSTDTSARDLIFYITNGTDYPLTTVSIPINSGNTNAIAPVGIMPNAQFIQLQFDPNGNRVIQLKSGDVLKVAAGTTVTAAKAITIFAQASDF